MMIFKLVYVFLAIAGSLLTICIVEGMLESRNDWVAALAIPVFLAWYVGMTYGGVRVFGG